MFRFFLVMWFFVGVMGCSFLTESESESIPLPISEATNYQLYPNDSAANDSVAAWLAQGAFLRVHPQTSYVLSFDTVAESSPPVMHLYRVVDAPREGYWNPVWIKKVEARQVGSRWEYPFDCAEQEPARWSVVLVQGDDYWQGPVNGLHWKGEGAYGTHLSLNLIVAGSFGGFLDSITIDSAAKDLLAGFRAQLAGSEIQVDSITVRRASSHPVFGASYPDNRPVQGGYDGSGLSTDVLGGWPEVGVYYALDIVLLRQFEWDGVLGLSPIFGGSLGGGTGSTVATATHYMNFGQEIQVHSQDWVNTVIHESGHFFGLRHTSSTTDDIINSGDASITEDGFSDTPVCDMVLQGGGVRRLTGRLVAFAGSDIQRCPDVNNLMFPYSFDGVLQNQLSPSQLALWQKSLQIMEH